MSIRSTLLAAAFTLVSLGAAHANGLRPIEGRSVDLGDVSGVASLRKSGTVGDQVEQDRVDVVRAGVGLVGADDVVERAEIAPEGVLAD